MMGILGPIVETFIRIALTSGLTGRQVATNLGVGFPTLSKWIQRSRPADMPPANDNDLAKKRTLAVFRPTDNRDD